MAIADLSVCFIAGAFLEARSRRRLLVAVGAAALAVGAAVHFLAPVLTRYRGASGIAVGLVVLAALDSLPGPSPGTRALTGCLLALVAVKLAFEASTGRSLIPGTLPPGVLLAPQAHMAGAAAAFVIALVRRRPRYGPPSLRSGARAARRGGLGNGSFRSFLPSGDALPTAVFGGQSCREK